jgi:hypothetical protein
MPESTIDRLFAMLEAQARLATKERGALTDAFERQITGLRLELRIIFIVTSVIVLALSGIGVRLASPAGSVTTTALGASASEPAEPAAPLGDHLTP